MLELILTILIIFAFVLVRNKGDNLLSDTYTHKIYKVGIISRLHVCSHNSKYYELALNVSPTNVLWKNNRIIYDRKGFSDLLSALNKNTPSTHKGINWLKIKVLSAPKNAEAAISLYGPLGWSQSLILRDAIDSINLDFIENKI